MRPVKRKKPAQEAGLLPGENPRRKTFGDLFLPDFPYFGKLLLRTKTAARF